MGDNEPFDQMNTILSYFKEKNLFSSEENLITFTEIDQHTGPA